MTLGNFTNRQLIHSAVETDEFKIVLIIGAGVVILIGIYGLCIKQCFRSGWG
jgi:hypothetical protein